MDSKSFTVEYNGISQVLISECVIRPAFSPAKYPDPKAYPQGETFNAIWDTGATNSVISKRVASKLGLIPFNMTTVNHAGGKSVVPVYKVNIELPNQVGFVGINVSEGVLAGADVLIGMDIITKGDFAVSNVNGHTTFTYRVPSIEKIDFVAPQTPSKPIVKGKEPGRNDPCPCGSGKKYKKCCGNK